MMMFDSVFVIYREMFYDLRGIVVVVVVLIVSCRKRTGNALYGPN